MTFDQLQQCVCQAYLKRFLTFPPTLPAAVLPPTKRLVIYKGDDFSGVSLRLWVFEGRKRQVSTQRPTLEQAAPVLA